MYALAQRLPMLARDSALPVVAAGVMSAALVGVALAVEVPIGIALLIAPCYAAIVLTDLPFGLALWVPLAFLEGIFAFNAAGKAAGLLLAGAWMGSFPSLRDVVVSTYRRFRWPFVGLMCLLGWLSLSFLWADDTSLVAEDLWRWFVLGLVFLVVATTVSTPRALRLVLAAFVTGAVLSVGTGIVDGSLTSAVDGGARFEGSAGDPNFLAASLIAATVLAGALMLDSRTPAQRMLLIGAVAVLLAGLVTSGSRGGALAAGVTVVAAFIVFKRRRAYVVAGTAVAIGLAALMFVNAPSTWERVTDFDNDNGRSDLWGVAWAMGKDNPALGVGLNNYTVHSSSYVRELGTLEHVELIVDRPHFVHNTYLQVFADDGVIGLGLFIGFLVACMLASKRAADRFDALGEDALATLARAVLVAAISMLAAAVFLSAASDKRLWLLLALGPALLGVASNVAASRRAAANGLAGDTPPARFRPQPRFQPQPRRRLADPR